LNTAVPTIADYELLRRIGAGSYGEVWLARGVTGAYRAIKIVWRERFADAAPFEREFNGLTELAALPALEPCLLAIAHVGKNDREGFFYYVMELADDVATGRTIVPARYMPLTLSSKRPRGVALPIPECLAIGTDLAQALVALHTRGLVHRDIKPSNVIFVEGSAKLADIGLVVRLTEASTFVGTEGFIPPEGPGTPAADIYALGKVLYECATGLDRDECPRLPPSLGEWADRRALLELNEIIIRACAPQLTMRYASAAPLLRDLALVREGRSLRRINGDVRRRRLALGLVLVAGAAGIGVVSWPLIQKAWAPDRRRSTADDHPEAWIARARALTDGAYTRSSVQVAEGLARRATEFAPQSAAAWATLAYCGACQLLRSWDLSAERRVAVQAAVNRALAIDRDEPLALLASAILFRRQQAYAQSELVARRARKVAPDDPRIWRVLSHAVFNQHRREEGLALAEEARRRFPTNALVSYDLALLYSQVENFAAFERYLDASLELQAFQSGLITKVDAALFRHGDIATARATLARFDPEERAEDRVVACAMNLGLVERNPGRVHEAAVLTASAYIPEFVLRGGPTAFWRALAFREEHKPALEQAQWEEAVEVLRKRRHDETEVPSDRARLATALARLGRFEDAAREIASYEAADRERPSAEQAVMLGIYYATLGDATKAVPVLRAALNRWSGVSHHHLRLHPWWDNLRPNPEFQDLLRETSTSPP